MRKYGGEIATACGSRVQKFYFKNGFRLQHHSAYQVERAVFDKMLLDRAKEAGAEVHEATRVDAVAFDAEGATLTVAGTPWRARYVLDASGRHSVVGTQLGLRMTYDHLKKFSCYAHYEQVQRDDGMDGTLTRLVRARGHWFWLIPLDERRTSIGLVMDSADFRRMKKSPKEVLAWALEDSELMRERMRDTVRLTPVYSVGDYSYRNRRLAGERWMLAGDAAGFIDPIFSTGVFLAIHSGEQCADALEAVLRDPSRRPRLFGRYERGLHRLMDKYLRFVTAWYRPEFVEVFTAPTERLQLAPAVNAVLAGNVEGGWAVWWRMQVFYLVLFLQRFMPLCPRLEAKPMPAAEVEAVA